MIKAFFQDRARRQHFRLTRRRLEAWRALKGTPLGTANMELARRLALTKLDGLDNVGAGMVPAKYRNRIELMLRQRLFYFTQGVFLYTDLMCHFHNPETSLSLALPGCWRRMLANEGVRINRWSSRFRWLVFQGNFFVKGLRRAAQLFLDSRRLLSAPPNDYALLFNLSPFSVPQEFNPGMAPTNFLTWYGASRLRPEKEKTLWAHIPGDKPRPLGGDAWVVKRPFPALDTFWERASFAAGAAGITLVALIRWLSGGWWAPVLLEDAIELLYVQTLGPERLASSYIFLNSEFVRRPLWTYFAEQTGSRVLMACYSTNMGGIHIRGNVPPPRNPGNEIMSWREYAVWDENQENYIRSVHPDGGAIKIHIVGPILLVDNANKELPPIPPGSIAVFDVPARRDSTLAVWGYNSTYYDADRSEKFFDHIQKAVLNSGHCMVLKVKRKRQVTWNKKYRNRLENISNHQNVIFADPDISPERIVKHPNIKGVICMPFTSVSILARTLGKPAVYYDPDGDIEEAELHPGNVPMLSTMDELSEWVNMIFDKENRHDKFA